MASVDRIQGLSGQQAIKTPCRLATTAAITLSGEQTIDGVAAVEGDRVLVKDQADTTTNGVYDVSTSSWTRSLDFDGASDIADGTLVLVGSGSTNADLVFKLNATEPIVIDTTALTFSVSVVFNNISAFAATLLDDANAAAAQATLGLEIGVNVQAYDADTPTVAASQVEMEAGTEAALRSMSPLRVAQAIAALVSTTPATGEVVKVARAQTVASTTGSTVMVFDDTIPQNTEGDEYLTCSITPSYATSKLLVEAEVWGGEDSNVTSNIIMAALFRDSTANAICATAIKPVLGVGGPPADFGLNIEAGPMRLSAWVDASAASSTTFKLRAGVCAGGSFRLNGVAGSRQLGGVLVTSITVTEIKQ